MIDGPGGTYMYDEDNESKNDRDGQSQRYDSMRLLHYYVCSCCYCNAGCLVDCCQ